MATPEPLWRELLGSRLRALRHQRGATLNQVATRAGISPQYLSEIERGRKEPSSEMIAALAGALSTTLASLLSALATDLQPTPLSVPTTPTPTTPDPKTPIHDPLPPPPAATPIHPAPQPPLPPSTPTLLALAA